MGSEADNIAATICLGAEQIARMEHITDNVDFGMSTPRPFFFWIRAKGFVCAVVLCAFIFALEDSGSSCQDIKSDIYLWIIIYPLLILFIVTFWYSLIRIRRKKENESGCTIFLSASTNFVLNVIAGCLAVNIFRMDQLSRSFDWFLYIVIYVPLLVLFIFLLTLKHFKVDQEISMKANDPTPLLDELSSLN